MKQVPSEIRTVAFNKESINVNFHSLSKITGTKCNYTFILIFITTYYLLHMFFFFTFHKIQTGYTHGMCKDDNYTRTLSDGSTS